MRRLLFGLSCLLAVPACGLISHERIVFDSSGIQVGIVSDLSADEHASPPVKNKHPSEVTSRDIRSLLGSLQVSGWSGMALGVFMTPKLRPVFTDAELALLGEPLATAFHQ